jgi:hypothetical protein
MRKKILSFQAVISIAVLAGVFPTPFFSYAGTVQNPIANPGVEAAQQNDTTTPEHWKRGFWGTNDAVFSYPAPGTDGTKGVKVEITSYESGDAKWYFDDVPVTAGEQYVFSGHYLANVPADVVARYTLRGGDYRYAYLGTSVISTEWTGYETFPFIVPEDAISLTVFHLIHETGALSVDNVSLLLLPPPPELSVTVQEPIPSLVSEAAGGAIPLSYITKIPPPSALPATVPTSNTEKKPALPIIDAALNAIHEMNSPLMYSAHAETETEENASLQEEAEKAGVSLGQAITSLQTENGGLSDRTMLFLGLSLLLLSFGIPILTAYQNNEIRREERLWEP